MHDILPFYGLKHEPLTLQARTVDHSHLNVIYFIGFSSFYFVLGWRDSILSLPKKWLSVSGATDDFGFPEVSILVPCI